ncbi:hypothetical protein H0H93_007688 [Arthromyces matolae]|nr:hypothetical protein H0H93_007688 [Arthromyces matolae]
MRYEEHCSSIFCHLTKMVPLGTAIYVYFILANYVGDGVTTETMCNFTLDGQYVSTFHHIPTTSTGYVFNALVFSRDGLSNTNHTLLISTSGINQHLFTNFDYANYTFDSSITSAIPSPTPSVTSQRSPLPISTQSTGSNTFTPVITVVGGVIAGIVVVLFALLAFLCFRQRKRAKFHSTRVRVSANESFYAGLSPLQALRPGTVISRWSESYTNVNPLDYSEAPPLPPPYIYDTSSESTCSDTVQSRRQAEINETIRSLTLEMERLAGVERSLKEQSTSLPSSFSLHRSLGETGSLTSLQEQMNATRGQIKYLKTQLRSSDWAQGSLDDRPPPTYSTIIIPRE